ncbi:hypothetical protein DCAR_0728198 [Daucus carota subsp. sativus]|uniref:Endonuclease/exonuclease/phosphatase domain-containing protein n=1 Tax=Daucus carota subsp. sativus TaxID=79200 RepID=A0AAF1B775_DAUCS|nr:PREDICTED: uncharacterized protein LOC108194672 [Daucus carota subsp. sativus]WOH08750.1 hypothetical protein DCAR_0728198 [Daucus carota subsp. sativus]
MVHLQETKIKQWSTREITSLGLGSDVKWVESPANGMSGGILTLWRDEAFILSHQRSAANWILVRGSSNFVVGGIAFLNVYAPQATAEKRKLWEELLDIILTLKEKYIMVIGDFNAVRKATERVNCIHRKLDSELFHNFITSSGLIEVPFINSDFTWYGPDAKASKLDRVLVSSAWFLDGDWLVHADNRCTSDHKPIIFKSANRDWGPKSFKFFNCWLQEEDLRSY